jgi:hypothetical protein
VNAGFLSAMIYEVLFYNNQNLRRLKPQFLEVIFICFLAAAML